MRRESKVRIERCARFVFYVKDWEGGVNQPHPPPQKCHESWLRLMKATLVIYAYPLIGSADFCTTRYNHGYTLIIAPCFSADLRPYSIPKRAFALIQQSSPPTICINALSNISNEAFTASSAKRKTKQQSSPPPYRLDPTYSLTHSLIYARTNHPVVPSP